ncbi:hypothetical protein V8G54_005181 [Vigna mungo]|uniref:16S rRNA processing protein RimM n=1 Tax=Vigna mungo TaxID=3915 RepID=A0AAQ3PFI0_VIGMU
MKIQALSPLLQRPFQPLFPPLSLGFTFKPSFVTQTKHASSFILFSRRSAKFHPSFATVTETEGVVIDDGDTEPGFVNEGDNELGFVNIGYISSVHGIQGEIRVKPATDFPELRFATPGRRWLKSKVLGAQSIQEVELEEGREHPGLKSWILKFRGIDTVEQAKMLIGSTLLVTKEDRPELEEGEFYTHDLIGMKVFMKVPSCTKDPANEMPSANIVENGTLVGTVVNVFNSGANDLLQIALDSSFDMLDKSGKSKSAGTDVSGQLVLVPFVEAIVPDVDMKIREMHITPPKGLLELNLRFDGRWTVAELTSAIEAKLINSIQLSEEYFSNGSENKLVRDMQEKGHKLVSEGKMATVFLLNEKEHQGNIYDSNFVENEAVDTSILQMFQKIKGRVSVPLILVSSAQQILSLRDLFTSNNYFAFDSGKVQNLLLKENVDMALVSTLPWLSSLNASFPLLLDLTTFFPVSWSIFCYDIILSIQQQKVALLEPLWECVWFLEEEKLPVVSSLPEGQNKYKILMKSPWEILQSPVGSGGLISLFSKHGIADNLIDMGVEYIELCCPSEKNAGGNSLLLGLVKSREAKIGMQIRPTIADSEKYFDVILSLDFVKKLQSNKLQFDAIPRAHSFVEKVDKEWVTVTTSTPNSFELSCSIYSSLNACSLDKVCIVEVRE